MNELLCRTVKLNVRSALAGASHLEVFQRRQRVLLHASLPSRATHPFIAMSRKRVREHSTSPQYHRVKWTVKRTRRGAILTAGAITPNSLETPVKSRRNTTLQDTGYSRDQTPIPGEGIEEAMSLPPIPAPEILAPKKGKSGKVQNNILQVTIN